MAAPTPRIGLLKRIAMHLPLSAQRELRRHFFARQIRRGTFFTDEKEYALLDRYVAAGDYVLDVGANVGHYTLRMSELAGPTGRVVAFEPVPETFTLLASNARLARHENVSLLNVAASDASAAVGIDVPYFRGGPQNFYMARIAADGATLHVLSLAIDSLQLPGTVKLAKIDVEGHELPVLRGMRQTLERDRPVLIVETSGGAATELLQGLGYRIERLPGSSNILATPAEAA